jgi:PAS domain S-box-containing protein
MHQEIAIPGWDPKTVMDWLLGGTFDYAVILDRSGRILAVNEKFAEQNAMRPDDLKGRSFFSLFPEDIAERRMAVMEKALSGRQAFQYEDSFQEGKVFDVRVRPLPGSRDEVTHIAVFFSDITEKKEIEAERLRLATAIQQAAEGIIIFDDQFHIQYVNQAFEVMTGYSQNEAGGKTIHTLYSGEDQLARLNDVLSTLAQGEIWSGRTLNTKKDGTIWQVDKTVSPIRGHRGVILGYVSVWRDVSQLDILEKQLRQAQKMEAIGTLAGGIAHDFNNILGPIILHAELVREKVLQDKTICFSMDQILEAADRARTLIDQILNLSRRHERDEPIAFELSSIVKECLKLLRPSISTAIHIEFATSTSQNLIVADPSQIHQVIMNLCTNAVHAMREKGGTLSIRLKSVRIRPQQKAGFGIPRSGAYVQMTISDTGHGMMPSIQERIFDPFFSTKNAQGTGLGLAVVHGIVTRLSGAIQVHSTPGKGSRFDVFFPQAKIPVQKAKKRPPSLKKVLMGNERILLVDDDPLMREGLERTLVHLGYDVTSVENGLEALKRFDMAPDRFDLMITDVSMPDMTGVELARQVLFSHPELPIILTSGFTEIITPAEAQFHGFHDFLRKPFHGDTVAEAIRSALDKRKEK